MEKVYTVTEVAKLLKVSRPTIYDWIKTEQIKASTLPSGKKRIAESEVKKYIKGD